MRLHRLLPATVVAIVTCCASIVAAPVVSADPERVCASPPTSEVVGLPDEFIAGGEAQSFKVSITNTTPGELPFAHYVEVTDWAHGEEPARHATLDYRSPETGDWLPMPVASLGFEILIPKPDDTAADPGRRSAPWNLASGATLTLDVRLAFDAGAKFPPGGVLVDYWAHIAAGEWTWQTKTPPCDLTVVPIDEPTPSPGTDTGPDPSAAVGPDAQSRTPSSAPSAGSTRPSGASPSPDSTADGGGDTAKIAAGVGIAALAIGAVAALVLLRRRRASP
ncbi:hypothetical protein B4N89_00275 [Embleya scabrispora]|uniref:Gram-positive cocci surface proteins LPxTG domain-containing protein n=1 Tax=Embleya scabrispora TaxID=159449 RepID=A0A1T3NS11_9ACTN|nr:hypothetical protein [Embleya scabrispora]OPC79588.1 hypothetical protein B4N89_00275 [Embleya scabrispora]